MILTALLLFVFGAFSWTFAEYGLHNWSGHKGRGRHKFSREHLTHHAKGDYFAPTSQKILAAFALLTPMGAGLSYLLSPMWGLSYTLGFGLGYFAYEVLHRRLHTHPPRTGYGRWARKHHFHHHFANSKVNHGVTSPLWDMVFGTYEKPDVIPVPEKLAMKWLGDISKDGVREEYRQDYRLLKKKKKKKALSEVETRVGQ